MMSPAHPLKELINARTLRDVYSVDIPIIVSPLTKPQAFADFDNARGYCSAGGIQKRGGDVLWNYYNIDADVTEPVNLSVAFEQAARIKSSTRWAVDIRKLNASSRRSSGARHPHMDLKAQPTARVYLCASTQPTMVVSHQDTLQLHEIYNPHILDLPFNKLSKLKFEDISDGFRSSLREAAKPLPPNTLCVMSGVTYHFYDGLSEDRTFLRTFAFNS